MTTTRAPSCSTALAHHVRRTRRASTSAGSICADHDLARPAPSSKRDAQAVARGRSEQCARLSSKAKIAACSPRAAAAAAYCDGDGRLARARRPDQQRAGAAVDAAAQQRVERRDAARDRLAVERRVRARPRSAAGTPRRPPRRDAQVVVAAAEVAAAELHDAAAGAAPARRPGHAASSEITPWAMLCSCRSGPSAVRSSSSSTVQLRPTKNCLSARICRR